MSLRTKFGAEGCKRFGDDKESVTAIHKPKPERVPGGAEAIILQGEVDRLKAENKALRQQVAELTLKLAGTKTRAVTKKAETGSSISGNATPSPARGRPSKLTPEQRAEKNRAKVKAWRKDKRTP